MRFYDRIGFGAGAVTCAPVTVITSRGQFPGSLTLSCMRTIAYRTQNLKKSVTKAKNTAQTQKSPLWTCHPQRGSVVLVFCFRPVSGKNKPAILE